MTPCTYSAHIHMHTFKYTHTQNWLFCMNAKYSWSFCANHVCCIQMSHWLTGTRSQADICHPPICQQPLLAIFSCANCFQLPSWFFFFFRIRRTEVPEDPPASPVIRRKLKIKIVSPRSPVSDTFTEVIKWLNFKKCILHIRWEIVSPAVCILSDAWEQPWSNKWFHPVTAVYSDKGQRTQRRGCQGNMVIEGKRQMCALHAHTYALAHSSSMTALPGLRIFNLWGLWQHYSIVIRGNGKGLRARLRAEHRGDVMHCSTHCRCMCTSFSGVMCMI